MTINAEGARTAPTYKVFEKSTRRAMFKLVGVHDNKPDALADAGARAGWLKLTDTKPDYFGIWNRVSLSGRGFVDRAVIIHEVWE